MKIKMKNNLGMVKDVKVGFSWTNLFFGFLTPLARGDFLNMFIQLIVAVITQGISTFIFPFIYNRIYINKLLKEGYRPITKEGRRILEERNFII